MARHGKKKAFAKRPAMSAPKAASPHRFTMRQEALNTDTRHNRIWASGNLRSKAVQFVSAGELQRSEFENVEKDGQDKAEETVEDQDQDLDLTTHETEKEFEQELELEKEKELPEAVPVEVEEEEPPLFVIDTIGEQVDTGLPDPVLPDPDLYDESSEDEVVFMGRNASKPTIIETDQKDIRAIQGLQQDLKQAPVEEPELGHVFQTEELAIRTQESQPKKARRVPPSRERFNWSPENDDILADYIANMDQEEDDDDDEDEDEEATAKATAGAGVQYVMADSDSESESDDDDVMEVTQKKSRKARTDDIDEMGVESSIDVLSKMHIDKPDPASEKEDADLATPEYADADLELDSDDDDLDLDTDLLEQLALEYVSKNKKGRTGKVSFPSASAFADAIDADPYYGFDIMDFDRPSLVKSRGKKQPALEMLSDSELEMHLQEVWQTDRTKKKTKKLEREELRAKGLLGKDPENADLKLKYAKGMNMDDLMTEVRAFLMSSKTTLSLPPMTKHRRKTIHELANILTLKSQSRGNGLTRFPILIKTSRTPGYTRKTISKVDSILGGRKINRRLYQSWGPDASRPTTKPKSRGGATAGVTYMDGDVVGASAPEIGANNRGRAMLEKMGWSSGTALGATNNKGILQPVAHVVKNSRAGLG